MVEAMEILTFPGRNWTGGKDALPPLIIFLDYTLE